MADPVIDATDITLGPGTTGGTYTGGAPDTGSASMFDGFNPTPKGAAAMQDAQREKLKDDTAASDKADAGMARHQAQMEHARAAEEYSIGSLPPPWDAKKEEADRIRGPFEAFGSPATIFAMAASAFTKRPMVNALNAGAAAMTAIHDHDEKSYTRAYTAWKDNTQLALDRFKMEHEAFRDSETLFNTDQIRWRQKATENALRFNDKTSLALMEQGLYQQYFEAQAAKAKASEAMIQEKTRIMQWEANRQTASALMQQAEKDHPAQKPGEEPKEGSWTPTQRVQYHSLVLNDVMNPNKKTDEGILSQGEREHFNRTGQLMTVDEKADLLQRMHSHYSALGGGTITSPEKKQEFLDSLGWTKEAIDDQAQTYNRTGQRPSNLGTRATSGVIMGAVTQRASELLREQGKTADDRARDWQLYKSQQLGINRFTSGPQGNTVRSLGVVVDHLSTLQKLGDALKNGQIPLFNRIKQAWAEQYGKEEPVDFDAAKNIIGTEIIKSLGTAGAGTVEERKGAADQFNRARSPEQLNGVIKKTIQPLLAGQLEGLKRQFKVATSLPDDVFFDMLGPQARYFLERKTEQEKPALVGRKGKDWFRLGPKDKPEDYEETRPMPGQ